MSIPSIDGIGRLAATGADTSQSNLPARPANSSSTTPVDDLSQQPKPPRFPWLSRLSQQLESASKQRATFTPAPILGDNVDKAA